MAGRGREASLGPVRLTGLAGVMVLVGVTALGALVGGLVQHGPGLVLEICLVGGTVLASLTITPRLVWLIVPLPPLVFVVMAVAAGVVGDHNAVRSAGRFTTAAVGWIAHGFIAMVAAVLLATALMVVRRSSIRR